jgi:hypothetical protein
MLSRSTQSAEAEAEAVAHAGRRAVAAHRRAAARPAPSAGMPDSRHHAVEAAIIFRGGRMAS